MSMQGSDKDDRNIPSGMRSVSLAGLVFIYITALTFTIICVLLVYGAKEGRRVENAVDFIPEMILAGIAVFSAVLGVGLVKAGGLSASSPNAVINPVEWDAIREQVTGGNEDAITQYIRLTSLTGFTGTFTKLGIQGLPLATIGMTLFFSFLFFFKPEFIELAKLTLGAFIGSFVQKQVGAASQGGGTVKLPSGETVKVSPSANAPV